MYMIYYQVYSCNNEISPMSCDWCNKVCIISRNRCNKGVYYKLTVVIKGVFKNCDWCNKGCV